MTKDKRQKTDNQDMKTKTQRQKTDKQDKQDKR